MSKIAKQPVVIPEGVDVVTSGRDIRFRGTKGEISLHVHERVHFENRDRTLCFSPAGKADNAMAGTMRALAGNMVQGVRQGFERRLELFGVGFRAQLKNNVLDLSLGFSHPLSYVPPQGLIIETPSQTEIVVKGIDKQKVGQAAAEIRALRPPEPYKGKGVRYAGEVIVRKEGKKR